MRSLRRFVHIMQQPATIAGRVRRINPCEVGEESHRFRKAHGGVACAEVRELRRRLILTHGYLRRTTFTLQGASTSLCTQGVLTLYAFSSLAGIRLPWGWLRLSARA
jgi:hypothetical protein